MRTHKGLFSDTRHCLFFKPDIRTGAKNWLTSDIQKSAWHSTLCFQFWGLFFCTFWVRGLDCVYSNSTLETLIPKSTLDIAKNLNSTPDILTPLFGPYNGFYHKRSRPCHNNKAIFRSSLDTSMKPPAIVFLKVIINTNKIIFIHSRIFSVIFR